jgi:hypothetical protein
MPAETRRLAETPEAARPDVRPPAESLGLAYLGRSTGDAQRLQPLWEGLVARVTADESDAGALLDMSTLLFATGNREKGLELQAAALQAQRYYVRKAPREPALRLLAFMAPGDLSANTPLDFLFEESGVELISCYLDRPPSPDEAPEHDVAFLAVGQSDDSAPLLDQLNGVLATWPRPVLNNRPDLIRDLTRDGFAARFAGHPHVLCPQVARAARSDLEPIAQGLRGPESLAEGIGYPIIVRPVGTHAGHGMAKVDGVAELAGYLSERAEAEFYVTAFVDYSGPDGLFRKLRIVFMEGRPYLAHMAISQHWMVHYLNADMHLSEAKRGEEAAMMAGFDGFVQRHAEALRAIHQAFPFDYFGIDCAESPDGRLLVFEADVALVVHALDPADIYPYKPPAMKRLFADFIAMLDRRAKAGPLQSVT